MATGSSKRGVGAAIAAGLSGFFLQACPLIEPDCERGAVIGGTVSDEAGNPVLVEPELIDPGGENRGDGPCGEWYGGFTCLVVYPGTTSIVFERGGKRYEYSATFDNVSCEPKRKAPIARVEFVVPAYDPASGEPCPSDTLVPVAELVSPHPVIVLEGVGHREIPQVEEGPVEVSLLAEHGQSSSEPVRVRGRLRPVDPSWCGEDRPSHSLTATFEVTFSPQPSATACAYDVVRVPVRRQDVVECSHVLLVD